MSYKSENKRFSSKSNANRAARADGLELSQITVHQDGAQFYYTVNLEPTEIEGAELAGDAIDWGQGDVVSATDPDADADEIDTTTADSTVLDQTGGDAADDSPFVPHARTLTLVDAEGDGYGPISETEAEAMAVRLANDENKRIMVVDQDGQIVLSVAPDAPEASTTPDEPIEPPTTEAEAAPAEVEMVTLSLPPVSVPSDKADAIAAAVAKILRTRVDIYDASGDALLRTIVHRPVRTVVKVEGEVKRAKKDLPSGKLGMIVAMCMGETGASTAEMLKATGWAKMPAKSMVKNLGDKYGLTFAHTRDGKEARYFLYRDEAEQIAA